jgi:hypothetical protein
MSKILSFGDRVNDGIYQVHSRFEKVVNLISRDSFISIVTFDIGGGPLNIVFDDLNLEDIKALSIDHNLLTIDGYGFSLDPKRCYKSSIDVYDKADKTKLFANLEPFQENLIELSPPKSLAVLLDGNRESQFMSSYDKELLKRFKLGIGRFFNGDYLEGLVSFSGLGYGLTPSGDDFIAGAMTGFNLIQKIMGKSLTELTKMIYRKTNSENPIVNAMLECARDGYLIHSYKKLVQALVYESKSEIRQSANKLMQIGHTSGADWGVGLYMTLKEAA